MSRLSPLTLPRFDVKALARTVRAHEAHTDTPDPQSGFGAEPAPEPDQVEPEESLPETLQAPVIPELPPVDTGTLLAGLERSMLEVERTALANCQQAVADFLGAAFPRLNEAFLAEEIALAMRTLVPPKVERLNLRVPETLEASFRQIVQSSETLAGKCDVQASSARDEITVDVDWGDGGLQFDMDQFLNSSLGRMTGQQHT